MFGLDEKLEELKQLRKSGLIDNDEYRDLRERAVVAYGNIPDSMKKLIASQDTPRTQPQRMYSETRTQQQRTYSEMRTQSTQPKRTQNTQQQKKSKSRVSPFAIFIIISILIGLLRDCN